MSIANPLRNPDLSILVVSFNCPDDVQRCLDSVEAYGTADVTWEFLVCENGREKIAEIRDLALRRNFRLVESKENIGFGKANNLLATYANGKFLLCLNPDTIVKPNVLAELVRHLEDHPECGACGPLLENPDGSLQDAWGPPTSLIWDVCEGNYLQGLYRKQSWREKNRVSGDFWEVGFVSGACICMKSTLWHELGGYDPDFFLNHEDVEFCDRIRARGLQVHILQGQRITHAEGTTQRSNWRNYTFHRQQAKWTYLKKRYSGMNLLVAQAIWWESIILKLVVGFFVLRKSGRSRIPGFLDAIRWVTAPSGEN